LSVLNLAAVRGSGLNLKKVGITAACVAGAGVLGFLLVHKNEEPVVSRTMNVVSPARTPDIPKVEPRKNPEAVVVHNEPKITPNRPEVREQKTARGAPPHDDFWAQAGKEIGGFSNKKVAGAREKDEERRLAGGANGSDFTPVGSCFVPPGTGLPLQLETRIVTEKPGLAKGHTTRDIWNTGMDCLAVPAGAVVTFTYKGGVDRNDTRVETGEIQLRRPWPQDDMLTIKGAGGDPTGAAGMPARIDYPWVSTGLLILASTATKLGTAALSNGFSLYGPVIGQGVGSPIDEAAREALHRAAVGEIDIGTEVVVVLQQGFHASDSR
jgi:type IV secretory pathway VirB10-like protein